MLVLLLILIFLRPFISSLAFPYLNAIYSGVLLTFLIVWISFRGILIKKIQIVKYPLLLFCFALGISLIFSVNRFNSFKEIYKYVISLLLFMIVISLDDEDKIRLVRIMVLSGLTIGLLAIYQYFFGFQHVLTYIKKEGIAKFNEFTLSYLSRRRAFLPFVTPNTLGGFLAMIVPLTFSFKHKNWLILLLSFALFLTKSLGAFLSFFCGLIIYFILKGRLEKKRIILLITLLVIFGLLLILRTSQQKYHLQPIFSTLMRLSYWQGALKIIQAHFLTGVGLGNFNLMQTRYAHNSYLQIWVEVGIIGLITFFWLIGIIFKTALQNIRNSPDKIGLAGLIAASFVFLLHNLIDFTFFLPEVSFYWWIILGLILKSLPNHFR